jgi:hypothetical protein
MNFILRIINSNRMRWACMQSWWERQKERELGWPRRRWENNIEMYIREIGKSGMGLSAFYYELGSVQVSY